MKTERLEAAGVAQIYKLWNEYSDAINSENLEQWSRLWCNDGIQFLPDIPQQSGKHQILKLVQTLLDQYHPKLSINPEVVQILGDQAYTYGSFAIILTLEEGKDRAITQRNGKFLTILRKRIDGSWKILVDCFNYNKALEKSELCSDLRKRGEKLKR